VKARGAIAAFAAFVMGGAAWAQSVSNIVRTALKTVETAPEAAQTGGAVAHTVEASSDWLASFTSFVEMVDEWVWGAPLVVGIIAVGILLSALLRLRHLFNLGTAFRLLFHRDKSAGGEVSQFGALCTALSATIGTGNIVGVATAIGTGGPGALFWMEVAAFVGMATKFAEGVLAVKYRSILPDGRVLGGPFYYIERGLKGKFGIQNWKPLACVFAFFGTLAGVMGTGTIAQVHGISAAVQRFFDPHFDPLDVTTGVQLFGTTYSFSVVVASVVVAVCVALVVIGGLKRISKVATFVVPFMALFYVVFVALLLLGNLSKVTAALELIVRAAFNPSAFTGGVVGSIFVAMQKGVARGIFSNEAGLGSEPIAAAAAKTNEPVRQGLVCMTGTFVDTMVICTMTGLAVVVTGAWEPSLGLKGVDVTIEAFRRGLAFLGPHSDVFASFYLMAALAFFAFTTIIGWSYYSEKCLEYLFGPHRQGVVKAFRCFYVLVVFIGPYLTVSAVWALADVFNGLMAFPNLVALVLLSPVVARSAHYYFVRHRQRNH